MEMSEFQAKGVAAAQRYHERNRADYLRRKGWIVIEPETELYDAVKEAFIHEWPADQF